MKGRLKKAAKKIETREKQFMNFDQIRSVMLFADIDNPVNLSEFTEIASILKSDKKKVSAVLFIASNDLKDAFPINNDYLVLTKKDLDRFGLPTKEHLKWVDNHSIDLLVSLKMKSFSPLDYLGETADFPLKAGVSGENNRYLDVMIDVGSNASPRFLMEQIIYYLRTINAVK